MTDQAQSCYLRTEEPSLLTVYLPDSTPVILGRSRETNITDTKCSREQVRLYADYHQHIVSVQQIGVRPCGLNGFKTHKNEKYIAKHKDHIEILYGQHVYYVEFNPPPDNKNKLSTNGGSEKRSCESESEYTDVDLVFHKIPKLEKSINSTCDKCNQHNDVLNDKSSNTFKLQQENIAVSIKEDSKEMNADTKQWEDISNGELLIYNAAGVQNQIKVAIYDMDYTLIKTKSGLVHPKDCNDWQIMYPEVPKKLKEIHSSSYKIVIFTNQAGLTSRKNTMNEFKMKIERVVQRLGVPIQVFISTGKGIYRKPAPGMWNILSNDKNGGLSIDKSSSFYVGDAAGREKNWAPGRKKDHSLVDRLMALNIGIQFQTPEEHFLNYKVVPYIMPKFNPKELWKKQIAICDPPNAKIISEKQEIVLMVGSPGSGKSHFVKFHLTDYAHVNRDTLGSWQKCVHAVQEFLLKGKRIVVDNTNPDPPSRERYITIAKKHNIPIRCFIMATNVEHAKHNNRFRELIDSNHIKITDIIINTYMKTYVPPTLEEGFDEIVKINFVPRFNSEEQQRLYEMYLLEN